jgi:hypothetical protein
MPFNVNKDRSKFCLNTASTLALNYYVCLQKLAQKIQPQNYLTYFPKLGLCRLELVNKDASDPSLGFIHCTTKDSACIVSDLYMGIASNSHRGWSQFFPQNLPSRSLRFSLKKPKIYLTQSATHLVVATTSTRFAIIL